MSHSHSWQCSEEPAFGICCSHPVEGFILPIKYFTRQRKHPQSTLLHPLWWFSSARGCLLGPSEQEAPSKDKKMQLFKIWRKGYRENKVYRGMFHPAGVWPVLWIGSTHGSQWQGRETEGQAEGHSTSKSALAYRFRMSGASIRNPTTGLQSKQPDSDVQSLLHYHTTEGTHLSNHTGNHVGNSPLLVCSCLCTCACIFPAASFRFHSYIHYGVVSWVCMCWDFCTQNHWEPLS